MLLAKFVFSQKHGLFQMAPTGQFSPMGFFFFKSDGVVLLSTSRGNCIKLISQNLTPCYVSNFFTSFPSLKPMISSLSALQKAFPTAIGRIHSSVSWRRASFQLLQGSSQATIWDWVPNLSQRNRIAKAYIDEGSWVRPESQGYITSCLT